MQMLFSQGNLFLDTSLDVRETKENKLLELHQNTKLLHSEGNNQNTDSKGCMHPDLYSSIITNSQNMKRAQMPNVHQLLNG